MSKIAIGDGIAGMSGFPVGNEFLGEGAGNRSILARANIDVQKMSHGFLALVMVANDLRSGGVFCPRSGVRALRSEGNFLTIAEKFTAQVRGSIGG